jgi:hypothetical protein
MAETLDNIFASYVNQGTLEEAATWMASLTRNHPELAEEFIAALQKGIAAAAKGDASVIKYQSGQRRRLSSRNRCRSGRKLPQAAWLLFETATEVTALKREGCMRQKRHGLTVSSPHYRPQPAPTIPRSKQPKWVSTIL